MFLFFPVVLKSCEPLPLPLPVSFAVWCVRELWNVEKKIKSRNDQPSQTWSIPCSQKRYVLPCVYHCASFHPTLSYFWGTFQCHSLISNVLRLCLSCPVPPGSVPAGSAWLCHLYPICTPVRHLPFHICPHHFLQEHFRGSGFVDITTLTVPLGYINTGLRALAGLLLGNAISKEMQVLAVGCWALATHPTVELGPLDWAR